MCSTGYIGFFSELLYLDYSGSSIMLGYWMSFSWLPVCTCIGWFFNTINTLLFTRIFCRRFLLSMGVFDRLLRDGDFCNIYGGISIFTQRHNTENIYKTHLEDSLHNYLHLLRGSRNNYRYNFAVSVKGQVYYLTFFCRVNCCFRRREPADALRAMVGMWRFQLV